MTNTGNVSLTAVTVTDPMIGLSTISCPSSSLAPQATETCTATYTTTQADVDRGSITNTGTAHGTPPTGPPVNTTSQATVPANLFPTIGLNKTASPTSFTEPGTVITYSYVVTNTGNVTLQPIAVTDPMPGLSVINCQGKIALAPEASATCTATYTTTQADVDRGEVVNTGSATGKSPQGVNVTDQATATVPVVQTPGIALTKSANASGFSAAGTAIIYSYRVTNTGNVTLHNISVTDPLPGLSAINCNGVTTLAPGASGTCIAAYVTTQTDVDAGGVTNTATVSGTPPTGPQVTASDTVTVPAVQAPGIGLEKTANIASFSAPGVVITYSYLVTNTGNVALTNVNVTDPMVGLSTVNCPSSSLTTPSSSETCTATYTTTQADVDRGSITNTGTAHGTPPTGPEVTRDSTATVPAAVSPALTILKSATPLTFTATGTPIAYSYVVTNTGNVTLNPVTVTDPLPGLSAVSCPPPRLLPGRLKPAPRRTRPRRPTSTRERSSTPRRPRQPRPTETS